MLWATCPTGQVAQKVNVEPCKVIILTKPEADSAKNVASKVFISFSMIFNSINPLPNNKILVCSKLKESADDNSKVDPFRFR